MEDTERVRFYSRELLSGKPACDIPRKYFPKIQAILEGMKVRAINEGSTPKVRQLQAILADVRACQQRKQKRSASSHASRPRTATYSHAEIEATLDRLVQGTSYDSVRTDMVPDLVSHARNVIDSLVQQRNLMLAQKYEDVMRQLLQMPTARAKLGHQVTLRREWREQLERTRIALNEEREKMNEHLGEHDRVVAEERKRKSAEWEMTVQKYDSETAGDLPPAYKKFSPKLLNIREQEKSLIKMRMFEAAGYIQMEADEVERQEMMELRRKFQHDRRLKKEKMTEQRNNQMDRFEENNAKIRRRIKEEHMTTIHALEQTITYLEGKIHKVSGEIRETRSATPSASPSRPTSPERPKSRMFLTQPATTPRPKLKKRKYTAQKVVYRPIASKWRMTANVSSVC